METKFIWVVHFEESDFTDLDCAFDSFEKQKKQSKQFLIKFPQ